jgi:hypothetical protein
MVLVDTSVWVEVFRDPPGAELTRLVHFDEVVTCLPVVQEVLQGFRDERAFQLAQEAMLALPIVESPLTEALVRRAVDLYRRARRQGITVRSSVDCLIAACALENHLEVLHHDRDFAGLAEVSPLRQRSIWP